MLNYVIYKVVMLYLVKLDKFFVKFAKTNYA